LTAPHFGLENLYNISNSSHPSAVAGAGCKKIHELQARNAAVVPAVVFRCSLLTTHKHKVQGAKHKIQSYVQTKAGRNGQSQSNLDAVEK
jgi:hypothetical protein